MQVISFHVRVTNQSGAAVAGVDVFVDLANKTVTTGQDGIAVFGWHYGGIETVLDVVITTTDPAGRYAPTSTNGSFPIEEDENLPPITYDITLTTASAKSVAINLSESEATQLLQFLTLDMPVNGPLAAKLINTLKTSLS